MELPKKIEIIEENYTAYIPEIVNIAETVNNLISYLESQKEKTVKSTCGLECYDGQCVCSKEEPKYTCKDYYKVHQGPWVNCVPKEDPKHNGMANTASLIKAQEAAQSRFEEPKQIDVEALLDSYSTLSSYAQQMRAMPLSEGGENRRKEIIKIFKQALQQ